MRIVVSMLVLVLARPLVAQAAPAPAFSATGAFSDFDDALAVLRERGVTIAYGPYPTSATQRANVIIKDNAGNLIQILGRAGNK